MSKTQRPTLKKTNHHALSAAGLLVTIGIIFGDIGTSPLYVLKAIFGSGTINSLVVLGSISAIFWTLTLQTTLKYVVLTLRADNKGEGGIFSLYTLVRRTSKKWLIVPAIIGGSTLLADGIITPAISVSSAIEGLRNVPFLSHLNTVPIVIFLLAFLFILQQFGTKKIGKFFGPMMVIWFLMLATLGILSIIDTPMVIKALNPVYAFQLLAQYPGGFWLLGAIFLCTTGAEALYSDLGHCGRTNIRVTWGFVKICLLLNYLGQGAWLLRHTGQMLGPLNPFYALMPEWFLLIGIGIATCATIIASQALISGSFTLINEAMRLGFWVKARIVYPTEMRGQIYIPSINWLLCLGCIAIVLFFKDSTHMEAAYGLAIVMTMLMTTTLLTFFLRLKRYPTFFILICLGGYLVVELSFLVANLSKFAHGGWVTLLIGSVLIAIMGSLHKARKIVNQHVEFVQLKTYLNLLVELSNDLSVPKYSTHLVYLTRSEIEEHIEAKILYSIFQKQPKRADLYWFIHVKVADDPYRMDYKVTHFAKEDVIRIDFCLGFRVVPRINLLFRKVVEELVENKEVDITSRYASLNRNQVIGDFRFVLIDHFLSYEQELPFFERLILNIYFILKKVSLSEEKAFGLDTSSVTLEKVPIVNASTKTLSLHRIYD